MKSKKQIVYVIEVRWDAEDLLEMDSDVLAFLRQYGSAEVLNVYVEEEKSE